MSGTDQQNSDVRVGQNKLINFGKTQPKMTVCLNLSGFGPILNDLDLVGGHGEATQREDVAQILTC